MTKKCGPELGGLLWRHLTPQKKSNIGAQLQSITCIKAPKTFWKIYFLYDFWCAKFCLFRAVFGLSTRNLTFFAAALYSDVRKKNYIHCRCTSTFSALKYCSRIFFKFLSYLYEGVRTIFCADFLDFSKFFNAITRNLWRHLATK